MADETVKAWQKIAKQLRDTLPGEWSIGRSGIKTLVVRQPIEWVIIWIGISRVHQGDNPRLMAGLTPLVGYFNNVNVRHGLTTPVGPDAPSTVDLTAPDALDTVSTFAATALARVAEWTPEKLAAESEEQLALPAKERGRPLSFQDAAGWRVALEYSDPLAPAKEAAEWFAQASAPDSAAWYRDLAQAWESGGQAAAREFLESSRAAAIDSLKLK